MSDSVRFEHWWCPNHGIVHEDNLIEGVDRSQATSADPDGWTDCYYCPVCQAQVTYTTLIAVEVVRDLVEAVEALPRYPGPATKDTLVEFAAKLKPLLSNDRGEE